MFKVIGYVFKVIGYFALTQTYEFFVTHSTLQLQMRILGDGKGYTLQEFCTETGDFVEVAETRDSPSYKLGPWSRCPWSPPSKPEDRRGDHHAHETLCAV